MEFTFTDEQEMIRDTADAFLAEVSTSEAVRRAMATELGYDPQLWQRLCREMYETIAVGWHRGEIVAFQHAQRLRPCDGTAAGNLDVTCGLAGQDVDGFLEISDRRGPDEKSGLRRAEELQ